MPRRPPAERTATVWAERWERAAKAASFLVLVSGVVGIISGVLPPQRARLRIVADVLGLPTVDAAAATSVGLGIVLVLLARGLRRRQRRAWYLAIALLLVGAAVHLVKGLDVEEAVLCLTTVVVLVAARHAFVAEPDAEERSHPLVLLLGLFLTSLLAGYVVIRVNLRGMRPSGDALRATLLKGFLGLHGPVMFPTDRRSDVVSATLLALGILTAVVPLAAALRTSRGQVGLTAVETLRLHRLLDARPGGDSLGYFALRQDKHVVFSASGKAAVSYRVVSGVALASGDPLGDPEAWPGAITAYRELVALHGWTPAVLGCSEQGGTAWQRAGLSVVELGDEAVVDVATFSLAGRDMRGVRQAVARMDRAGYRTRVRRVGDLEPNELEELRHASATWRDGTVERGFSMALGRLGEPGDEGCVVAESHHDGQLQALLHFVPWGRDGLSLDLMRRARDCPNGINEQLVVAALVAAPCLGVRHISLNFAVFRSALERGARLGAGPILRLWRATLLLASRFWQIESLYRFNDKFGPRWEPRFLCFRRTSDLPRVMLAALQAEAFLPSFGRSRVHGFPESAVETAIDTAVPDTAAITD
ncbi:MAG TPA: phosphatidylglycerol lysyltransferase domain-containing protein [Frankiaceae bacterium]|nr:phosphatidylglycerol lysyltransferase domain-containing protein [Frankiaceae bacterium]